MKASENKRKKSVALKYESQRDIAPKVIASGYGEIAKRIIEIAKENNIPIYQDESLTDFLVKLKIGDYIPEELYKIVAQIFVWVWDISGKIPKKVDKIK